MRPRLYARVQVPPSAVIYLMNTPPAPPARGAPYEIPLAVLHDVADDAGCEFYRHWPAAGRELGAPAFGFARDGLGLRVGRFWRFADVNLRRPASDPDAGLLDLFRRDAQPRRTAAEGELVLCFPGCSAV